MSLKNYPLWHPCAQMHDYASFTPITIKSARGSYVYLQTGQPLIDAYSSWWCKNLGHGHPRLLAALQQQSREFEHVVLANANNDYILQLSDELTRLTKTLSKIMYASDGSSAVDMALKMSLQAQALAGRPQKTQFISLSNSYHGDSIGALSVSDLGIYRQAYQALLFDTHFIHNLPYLQQRSQSLWQDCSEHWQQIEKQLQPLAATAAAIIIEPIIQGAGGMQIYSAALLTHLRNWCDANQVYLIADEIFTGFGRSGVMLACEYADIEPDFLCLGKGLTAGCLAMSAMLTTDEVYELFYADYRSGKNFLHSHTFGGNALATRVALETLSIMRDESVLNKAQQLGVYMLQAMQNVNHNTGRLTNIRQLGAVVAADLVTAEERAGYKVYQRATQLGALLRPLGNTLYWAPPLITEAKVINELAAITQQAIMDKIRD